MNRPYLETKIVKVRSEKKKEYCPRCGSEIIMEKAVGNWVNGEYIDKIKFPCFCSFRLHQNLPIKYGEIDYIQAGQNYYRLREIKQVKNIEVKNYQWFAQDNINDLKRLFIDFGVHILKGKIIIFEEEK